MTASRQVPDRPGRVVVAARRVAAALLTGYQCVVSPLLPPCCRFAPTCSEYARLAVLHHGVVRGLWLSVRRLARCHPLHPGGWDPPPALREGRP
ncbi:MAG TPA: membrane protein insertion efficiency factor YidD [Candidatus Tectomicrobia bacterium]|nr:membrane protein insertion efficiency factor YidD [Candidatus Tectomicrobia bacterium]